jgi:hypothetical protein
LCGFSRLCHRRLCHFWVDALSLVVVPTSTTTYNDHLQRLSQEWQASCVPIPTWFQGTYSYPIPTWYQGTYCYQVPWCVAGLQAYVPITGTCTRDTWIGIQAYVPTPRTDSLQEPMPMKYSLGGSTPYANGNKKLLYCTFNANGLLVKSDFLSFVA